VKNNIGQMSLSLEKLAVTNLERMENNKMPIIQLARIWPKVSLILGHTSNFNPTPS